jgi:membrane protein YdbS with pleckstrin-like domain
VPILLLIIFDLIGVDVLTATAGNQIFGALAVLPFILLSLGLTVYHYLDWRNDDFILTTKRFIHIERKLLYGEQRDEAPLTRIQDVGLAYPGFLNRFDYYHLRIKTAGAGDIRINGITHAQQMKDAIFQEKERAMERVRAAGVAAIRQQLARQLQWQDTLKETILSVAEEEGSITTSDKLRRLPGFVHYFIPRLQEIQPDGTTIVWHKHYWVLLWVVGLPLGCVLLTIYLLLASIVGWFPFTDTATWFIQAIFGMGLLASLGWYLWRYDGWRRDIYQLTETRISDVSSSPFGLGGEIRSEGNLEDIQNITYNIPGLFYNLLHMGNVIIETAGSKQTFSFHKVYNPSGVQQEIFNRMVRVQQREREQRRSTSSQDIIKVFTEYQYLLEKAADKGLVKLGGEQKS